MFPQLEKLAAGVGRHLGATPLVILQRLVRLVAHVAEAAGVNPQQVADQLALEAVHDVAKLIAEGPHEQSRAILTAVEVHPVEHAGVGGHAEPPAAESGEKASERPPSLIAGA